MRAPQARVHTKMGAALPPVVPQSSANENESGVSLFLSLRYLQQQQHQQQKTAKNSSNHINILGDISSASAASSARVCLSLRGELMLIFCSGCAVVEYCYDDET